MQHQQHLLKHIAYLENLDPMCSPSTVESSAEFEVVHLVPFQHQEAVGLASSLAFEACDVLPELFEVLLLEPLIHALSLLFQHLHPLLVRKVSRVLVQR